MFSETTFPCSVESTIVSPDHTSALVVVDVDLGDYETARAVMDCRGSQSQEAAKESTASKEVEAQVAAPVVTGVSVPANVEVTILESVPREEQVVEAAPASEPVQELGRGHRVLQASVKLKDYICYNSQCLSDKHKPVSSSSSPPPSSSSTNGPGNNTSHPISAYVSDAVFLEKHQVFLAAITAGIEPRSFKEAMRDPRFREAMSSEVVALERERTWDVVDLPKGKKALSNQWIHKIKYNADGTVERYKSRLVVCGNKQTEGVDYDETFAPVAKLTTVRTMLEVGVALNWEIHQMDVHNAFLHGDLKEEVYMKLPQGFQTDDPSKVCRLKKSLYGLKQAPRCWFAKLTSALKTFGVKQSYADYSLFTYIKDGKSLRVLVYVDDLVIAGNDLVMLEKFKVYLSKCFKMKDLGEMKYFLGIEIARGPQGMFLSQRKYALDIVAEAGLLGFKPVTTPMEQNHKLLSDKGPLYKDPARFRRYVGRLVYLAITHPELCYSIHVLSQVMHQPREVHWDAVVRILKYLKGCPGQGVMLKAVSDLRVRTFCDSDWASCPNTRRSLSAFIVLLGDSPISWKTMKQDTVSHSSAEAEYRSIAAALREMKWLKRLLADMGIKHNMPMELFCDSKAALYIAANPVFHERTKHIEADCHSVWYAVQDRLIVTRYVRTMEQLADIITKALGSAAFHYLQSKLGVRNLHSPT